MKRLFTIITIILLTINSFAQIENHYIRQGNRQYKKHNYARAESKYKIALNKNPKSYPALFNLGLALYKQNNDTSALGAFLQLSRIDTSAQLKAKTFYNLGVVFTKIAQDSLKNKQLNGAIKNLQNAVQAFKSSVIFNPQNYNTRYNLWVTQKLLDSLKQQQQQKQKNKQNKQNQNKQNKNNKNKQNQQKNNQNNKGGKNQKQNQKNKDSDGDGIPDKVEKQPNPKQPGQNPPDSDNDGIPDYLDQDSDNDGVPDRIEAGKNPLKPQDTNHDGIPDYREKSVQAGTMGLNPQEINRILSAIQQADKQTQQKAMKRLMNVKSHERKLKPW